MSDKRSNEQIIHDLTELKEHPGWKIVQNILKQNIYVSRLKLDGEDEKEIESTEEMRIEQAKIKDRRRLYNLPDEIIGDLKQAPNVVPNFDPYFTQAEIEKELKADAADKNPQE